VLIATLPCASTAATCKRALRSDSLGNVPLQRSSVGAPATEFPLGSNASPSEEPRSLWRNPTFDSADAPGTVDAGGDGAVLLGPPPPLGVDWLADLLDPLPPGVANQPITKPRPPMRTTAPMTANHLGTKTPLRRSMTARPAEGG
jgi:hypothetical protein